MRYLIGIVLLALASPAAAQVCVGQPSLDNTYLGVTTGFGVTTNQRSLGGGIALGRDAFFGTTSIGYIRIPETTLSALVIDSSIGGEAPLGKGKAGFCPLFGVTTTFGPTFGVSQPRTINLGFGGRVGVIAGQHGTFSAVPTFGFTYVHAMYRDAAFPTVRDSADFGLVSVGVGIRFSARTSLTPEVAIPIRAPATSDPVYSFLFAFTVAK